MLISKFDNANIDKYIAEFEESIKTNLPKEYRCFLKKYNGGRTVATKFDIKGISANLEGFYGVGNAEEDYNFQQFTNMCTMEDFLKDGMLPIADTTGGDYIILGIKWFNRGKVFYLCHDESKKYIKLANTLSGFIAKCKSDIVGKVPSIEERRQSMIVKGKEEEITTSLIRGWQREIEYYSGIHQEELRI